MLRCVLLVACAAAVAATMPQRTCPPPEEAQAAADVLIVVAGGRPDSALWRSLRAEAAAWLADGGLHAVSGGSVRVAVAQHSVAGGLELLSAPGASLLKLQTAGER